MRWLVLVGSMMAGAACTSLNPAYDATAGGTGQDPSDDDPTGSDGITSTTVASSHADTSEAGSDTLGDSSSTGDVPLPDPLCRFELFAVNESGQIYVLDPDEGDSRLRLDDPELASWAIATEPSTGILYVNQLASPNKILRVDPFVPEILPDAIAVEVEEPLEPLDTMARATFRGESELWIGTHETHRFVWVPPTGGTIVANEILDPFSRGGDMVFIEEEGCAVVPTLDGLLYSACFPAMPGPVPPLQVDGLLDEGFQFTGIAIDEQERLWLSTADPNPSLVHIDRAQQPWSVGARIPYEITMNDLAAVIHRDDCGM